MLTLAHVVGMRNGDGWFTAADIDQLHEDLRLPRASSVSRILGQLRNANLTRNRNAERSWSLTPVGVKKAQELISEFDYEHIYGELLGTPGADFANARHTVIPPSFAPAKWQAGIGSLVERYPFETNVFCMTRFPRSRDLELPDPLQQIIDQIRKATQLQGLRGCLERG